VNRVNDFQCVRSDENNGGIKYIMNNIKGKETDKGKEFIDELDVDLNNFEIAVKNCDIKAVDSAYNIGTHRKRMNNEQVEKFLGLKDKFVVFCRCDNMAKKANY